MSYSKEIYEIENKARTAICNKLDEVGEIKLLSREKNEEIDWDEEYDDELTTLPVQRFIGKHETIYFYTIIRLCKGGSGYYAEGLDRECGDKYFFDLFSEIDSYVMAEIADHLKL